MDVVPPPASAGRFARLATFIAASLLTSPALAAWPSLETSVSEAQQRSEGVVRAQAEVLGAKATQRGARIAPIGNPYLDFQVDRGSTTTKDVQALAFLYTPIEIFGQRGARIGEADAMKQWRDVGVTDARALAQASVIIHFGAIQAASERMSIAEAGEQAARAEAAYFEGRFAAQDATLYDKSLAQAELSRWLQIKSEAILRITQSRVELLRLTGNQAWLEKSKVVAPKPPALQKQWNQTTISQVVEKSPTLQQNRAEGAYWAQAQKRWRAERRMPVELLLIGGRGDPGDLRLGGGLTFRFPVFQRNQGEVARAEAGEVSARRLEPVLQTAVKARLQGAALALASMLEALELLDKEGIPAGEAAVDASYESYKRGKIELLQVLLARRELASAKTRRLDLLESAWRAYAELAALSGDWP